VAKLQSAGLRVSDVVVFIDHGLGASERLAAEGLRSHAVLHFAEIKEMLFQVGRIDEAQYRTLAVHA
jgi:uridine monophosphate synthetase